MISFLSCLTCVCIVLSAATNNWFCKIDYDYTRVEYKMILDLHTFV
jgi:hypothetical protein